MPITKFEYAKSVAKHELGHWFAAKHFGFNEDFIDIEITFNEQNISNSGHAGSAQFSPVPVLSNQSDTIEYIEKRIICLHAGAISESYNIETDIVDYDVVNELYKTDASVDYGRINELAIIVVGIDYSKTIDPNNIHKLKHDYIKECQDKTFKLLDGKFELIDSMAESIANQLLGKLKRFTNQTSIHCSKSEIEELIKVTEAKLLKEGKLETE